MNDKVTILEGLMVSGVSMLVVFAGLGLIALLIMLLAKGSKVSAKEMSQEPEKEEVTDQVGNPGDQEIENQEELVAVISAAIAASLGVAIPQIKISSIKRTNQSTNTWREVSKQEQIYGRL